MTARLWKVRRTHDNKFSDTHKNVTCIKSRFDLHEYLAGGREDKIRFAPASRGKLDAETDQ